jgi:hypothetical protein
MPAKRGASPEAWPVDQGDPAVDAATDPAAVDLVPTDYGMPRVAALLTANRH